MASTARTNSARNSVAAPGPLPTDKKALLAARPALSAKKMTINATDWITVSADAIFEPLYREPSAALGGARSSAIPQRRQWPAFVRRGPDRSLCPHLSPGGVRPGAGAARFP